MEVEQHGGDDASSPLVQHDLPPLSTASSQFSDTISARSSSPVTPLPLPPDDSSPSIEKALASLTVNDDEQERMFKSLEIIFRNAQDRERSLDLRQYRSGSLWALLERADESSQRGFRDIEALRDVRGLMDQMLWKDSQLTLAAARTLADASRDGKNLPQTSAIEAVKGSRWRDIDISVVTWRIPFGEAGILDLFLNTIAREDITDEIALQSLRLIGNSCGDTG